MPTAPAATPTYVKPPVFIPLPLGEVKPAGWLRDWCQDAANGIAGHADELDPLFNKGWVDPSINPKNTGKMQTGDKPKGYALEQAGYWIDGATRLAHLLGDEALLAKCRIRFEAILKRVEAHEPPMDVNRDMWVEGGKWAHWPMAVMGRALLAEYSFSHDPRYLHALEAIYANYAKYEGEYNSEGKAFSLIHHRGRQPMNVEVMLEAYRMGGSVCLREEAIAVLRSQNEEIKARLGWHEKGIAQGKMDKHFYMVPYGHAVTLNESAKIPAIGYQFTGDADWLRFSEASYEDMEKNEMLPYGLTSGHEELGGVGPFSTTEMCNAIDYAWSNLWLMRITGKSVYGDRIERDFFNAAPGGIAPDFKSHVYFLSANRIDPQHPGKANAGGTPAFEPKQFPLCCTGNLARLLPNYVMHLWMASDDGGLAATLYGPSETQTVVAGAKVALSTRTEYPFGDEITIQVAPERQVVFPMHLRVPAWCTKPALTLNGKVQTAKVEHGFIRLERTWKMGDVIGLNFPREPRVTAGVCTDGTPYASVSYGALLFALPIATVGGNLNVPQPGAEFQFALTPGSSVTVSHHPMPARWSWGVSPAPLELTIKGMPVAFGADWALPKMPVAAEPGKTKDLTLVPFGMTAFRVSMFGVAETAK